MFRGGTASSSRTGSSRPDTVHPSCRSRWRALEVTPPGWLRGRGDASLHQPDIAGSESQEKRNCPHRPKPARAAWNVRQDASGLVRLERGKRLDALEDPALLLLLGPRRLDAR